MSPQKMNHLIWNFWDVLKSLQTKQGIFLREFSQRYAISTRELRVLVQIELSGKVSLSLLAKELDMNPGNLSRLLSKLEEQDYIERTRDRFDSRKCWLSLKDKSTELLKQFDERLSQTMERYLSSPDRLEEFETCLNSLNSLNHFLLLERHHEDLADSAMSSRHLGWS